MDLNLNWNIFPHWVSSWHQLLLSAAMLVVKTHGKFLLKIGDNNGDKNKYLYAVRLRVEICWKYDLLTTLSWRGWTRPGRPCRPVTDTQWAVYRVWRVSLISERESCFYITPRLRLQSLWKSYYFILCSWGQYPTHLLWTLNLETFLWRIIQGYFSWE